MRSSVGRRMSVGCLAVLVSWGFASFGGDRSAFGAEDVRAQIQEIKERYQANKSHFERGKVRLKFTRFLAENEADGWALKPKEKQRSAVCTLVFGKDRMAARTPLFGVDDEWENSPPLPPLGHANYLKKDGYAIEHESDGNWAWLSTPEHYTAKLRLHPFHQASDVPRRDPLSLIEYAERHSFENSEFKFESNVEKEGKTYLKMTFQGKDYSHVRVHYLDPQRGYLPFVTEMLTKEGELLSRMLLIEVHQDGNAFCPMRAVDVHWQSPKSEVVVASEMKVLDLDLSYEPKDSDFMIEIPRRTSFLDNSDPDTQKTGGWYPKRTKADFIKVYADDIVGIHDHLLSIAKERREERAKREAEAAAQ